MKISLLELSKSFGGRDIFLNFSLEVDSGMRLCVCGPNGTGKSTLLRMMAGVEPADSGRVLLPKDCRLGYVEQELSEESLAMTLMQFVTLEVHDWTDFWQVWDQAALADDQAELAALMAKQAELEQKYGFNPEQRAKEVLSGLGFAQEKWALPLRELSGGWRERAKLARVLTTGADVLLLDEPTNHLDMDAVEWLENFLLDFRGALVFVAHDRRFMDKVGNYVLYLGLSRPVLRKTNYSGFLALQEEYEIQRQRKEKALQEDYNRKMAFVERFRAKATKARQAASRQKMARKLEKELEEYRPEQKRKDLAFSWPEAPHSEKVMLACADLAFNFPDGKTMWPPLTFTLYRGARVALVGHNGSGKSTLLKLIAGKLEKSGGNMASAPQMRLGYYTQHQMETLRGDITVLAEIRRLADPRTTEEELMSVLGLFLLGQNYFDRQVSSLSGGEKSRLVLASLFLRRSNFLLLDEPTNHLDLESREALADALLKFNGTLLLVAHDRWLLSRIGAEIWELSPEGITVFNDFATYEQNHALAEKPEDDSRFSNTEATGADMLLSSPNQRREEQKKLKRQQAEQRNALYRLIKPLQANYEKLEKELELVLGKQEAVEKELAKPEVYADQAKANNLLKDYENYRSTSEKIIEEMSALEARINACKAENEVTA